MKNKILGLFICLPFTLLSCKNNPPSDQSVKTLSSNEFYPISNYIYSQLKYLDSMPLAVIKYTTI
ncbi:MAG TPA: hypothetical protein VFV68_05260, partial [Agriterribacter sp.]|nr:hypothetical protein [Agriterribacter sp.]